MNHSVVTLDVLSDGLLVTTGKNRVTSQCCGLESAIRIMPLDDAGRPIGAIEEFGDRWKAIRRVLGVGSRVAVAGSKQDKPTVEIKKHPQNDEPRYLVGKL